MDTLPTSRFRLEPLNVSHAAHLFASLSAPEIYHYVPRLPPPDVAALSARYQQLGSRGPADGSEIWLNWAIYVPAEDRYVGKVQVTVFQNRHEASLAYLLAPSHWGIGCATEVCRAVMQHLFVRWEVQTIGATTDTRNERSIRLLERLGFSRTVTQPSEDLIAGEPTTEHVYQFRKAPSA